MQARFVIPQHASEERHAEPNLTCTLQPGDHDLHCYAPTSTTLMLRLSGIGFTRQHA